jgi:hypothetical protein
VGLTRAKNSENLSIWLLKSDPRGEGNLKRLSRRTGIPSGTKSLLLACVSRTDHRNRHFRSFKFISPGCVGRNRAKTSENLSIWLLKAAPRDQGFLRRLRGRTGVPSGRPHKSLFSLYENFVHRAASVETARKLRKTCPFGS